MSKWALVRLLHQGYSYIAAGKELRRTLGTIEAAAHQVGISGRGCVYDLGEPFDVKRLQRLKRASGLSASRFAEQVKIPKPVVAELVWPVRRGQRIRPDVARKIIAWRDGTIRRLVAAAWKPEHGEDKYSGSRVLKTLLPGLNARRDLLHEALRELRRLLRARPSVAAEDLGEFLCEQAMLETAQNSPRKLFVRFLPWAPELLPFLQANFDRLRSPGNLSPLADKALAARWGTTRDVFANALTPRTRSIPPNEMRRLLARAAPGPASHDALYPPGSIPPNHMRTLAPLTHAPLAQPAEQSSPRKPKQPSGRQIERGRRCDTILSELRLIRHECQNSGLTVSEIQSRHPNFEVWQLRDALSEEDREVFNHPRRWGPVVGYGLSVLAKDYGKHTTTVRDWVKMYRRQTKGSQV